MLIYDNIVEISKKRNMTLRNVEKKASLANGTIGKWKTCNPQVDSLMKVAKVEADGVESILKKLEAVSEKFKIDFVISVSVTESDLSDEMKANVILSL